MVFFFITFTMFMVLWTAENSIHYMMITETLTFIAAKSGVDLHEMQPYNKVYCLNANIKIILDHRGLSGRNI